MGKLILRNFLAALVLVALLGCGANSADQPAVTQLRESYEKSPSPVKQEVGQATAALQAGNYAQAIHIMDRVVQAAPVDAAQKQALDALIIQTRRAVQGDPKLETPQLYKSLADLTRRLHGEN